MKVKLQTYTESKSTISIEWDSGFEESVIKEILGNGAVLAKRYCNCIHLEKMDDDLNKLITKYFKKKYGSQTD